jgi:hypothetical protein
MITKVCEIRTPFDMNGCFGGAYDTGDAGGGLAAFVANL